MKKFIAIIVGLTIYGAMSLTSVSAEEDSSRELSERVEKLERKMEEKGGSALPEWLDRIALSGLVEVEAGYVDIDPAEGADEDESDIAVSTVELGIDAKIVKHVSGRVLFLYENGEDIAIDEAFVTISGEDKVPLFVSAGEMYVPFGNFESQMISDPFTLEIAETREAAVLAGFEAGGLAGSVFVFNGDVEEADDDNHIDNFGANLAYATESDAFKLAVGLSYINNLTDADSWEDMIDEEGLSLDEYASGLGGYAVLVAGPLNFIGEYIVALDDIEWSDAEGTSIKEDRISAWNLEAGYEFPIGERVVKIALAYQGTDDAWNRLPENRYMGLVGAEVFEYTSLALEYRHDEYENDDEEDALTLQLAIAF